MWPTGASRALRRHVLDLRPRRGVRRTLMIYGCGNGDSEGSGTRQEPQGWSWFQQTWAA